MTGKLKALSIALLGAFAMSAVAASSASAIDTYTSSQAPVAITGVSHVSKIRFTGAGAEFKCTTARYAATQTKSGTHELTVFATFLGKSNETPHQTACESNGFGNITAVDMNGCDFDLTGNTTQSDEGKTDAVVSLTCPTGKEIVITNELCNVEMPEQTPTIGGVTFTNEAGGKVKATATATGLKYTVHGPFCNLAFGSTTTWHDADFNDTVVTEGFEDLGDIGTAKDEYKEGKSVSISVSTS